MELEVYETDEYFLHAEWVVNIQVPFKVAEEFVKALGEKFL